MSGISPLRFAARATRRARAASRSEYPAPRMIGSPWAREPRPRRRRAFRAARARRVT